MQIRIPIFTISFLVENTQRAISDSKDYFEIMDSKIAEVDERGLPDLQLQKGSVVFDDVSFGYTSHEPVIRQVSFQIKHGQKAALVGESGEGKTTISNLLMRLYSPDEGRILIDDQDIAKVNRTSLHQAIATVFQEPALFSGTIRENIGYARPDASDEDIAEAARQANAEEFITSFEKGYDTEIGERGLKLSGGQKQRIAIARALLKNAPILILDEATSSLDSRSEAKVKEALERLMEGRTTIIIAHRLSTIQHVDRIITLRNGRVDEIGTPRQLARSGGLYQRLLDLQQGKNPEEVAKALRRFGVVSGGGED